MRAARVSVRNCKSKETKSQRTWARAGKRMTRRRRGKCKEGGQADEEGASHVSRRGNRGTNSK